MQFWAVLLLCNSKNSKNGLYKCVNELESLTCCQMLSNKQYNDDTVEKYVCRENLNYKVNNNFPNSYPNDQCKVLLGNWCNSSGIDNEGNEYYNIEDDRIKILHFPQRKEYVDYLQNCDVFVS
jgi:hypothetical protein